MAALCALPASGARAQFADFQAHPWQGGVNHFYGNTLITSSGTFSNSGALTYNTSTLPLNTGPLFGWDLTPGVTRSGDYYYGVGVLDAFGGGINIINNHSSGTMQGIVTGSGQAFGIGLYEEESGVTINNSGLMDGEVRNNDGTAAGVYATGVVTMTNNVGATLSATAPYYAGGIYSAGGGAQYIVNNGRIVATATGATQGPNANQAYAAGIDVFSYDPSDKSPIYVMNNGSITVGCTGGATNIAHCGAMWDDQNDITWINNGTMTATMTGSSGDASGIYFGANNADVTFINTGTINNGGGPGGEGVWMENDGTTGDMHFYNSGTIASGEPFAVAIAAYSGGPYGHAYVTNTGTISGGWLGIGWPGAVTFVDSGDIRTALAWIGGSSNVNMYISGLPTIQPTLSAGSGGSNALVFDLTGTLQQVNGNPASGTNLTVFNLGSLGSGSIVVSGKTYRWSNFTNVSGTVTAPVPLLAGPTNLTATVRSRSQAALSWNALANATSYNVKRSLTSGGPYSTIASDVAVTHYTDNAAFVGLEYYYVVSAEVGGSKTANSAEVALPYSKLTGDIIGTPGSWNNSGNTISNVFDNNLNTFFDAASGNGDWAGLYFGATVSNAITQINFCPRSGFEGRMVGGIFQGANQANFSDAVTLYTVTAQPASGVFTSVSVTNTSAFRYVRYLSPTGGFGNVAELQFYGHLAGASVPVPPAPDGLAAAAISGSQIGLSWSAVTNAASYNVKRSTAKGGPYSTIATGVTATNYTDTGLNVGTTYYYVVSTVNAGAESANSAQVGVIPVSNPPFPWTELDLGNVGARGSASYTNGMFTVTGSGADIWDTDDAFRFVYVRATNNCAIIAQVTSVQDIDAWSKAGVMIRESLNANAANAFIAVTPGNGVTFQYRSTTGTNSDNNNITGLTAPYWVKLVRIGNTFFGYRSPDGVTWTLLGSRTISMASTAYVGLAVTAHNSSSLCAATFGNVTAPDWPLLPGAPGSLTATAGNTRVVLSWPASDTATSYNVKRSITNGGPYSVVSNVTVTNYTDTGLTNGTTYYYVVSGLNTAGEGANSAQASAAPQAPPPLSVSLAGTNFLLSWPAGSTGFTLQSTTNLAAGKWVTVTPGAPQIMSNHWQALLPPPTNSGTMFYRLAK